VNARATYLRLSPTDLDRFVDRPAELLRLDLRAAIADGRALDLGRGWDELGCFLEGGITTPKSGPTVGERHLETEDERADWAYVSPARVRAFASHLGTLGREAFMDLFRIDDDETADALPEEQTGVWIDRGEYLFHKLAKLSAHYAAAAERGEAMLVRIASA
jgi:hypothetical protein